MWLVDCNKDKRNLSTADRSHQLTLIHLRQPLPSMSLLQHPIIKSATFGENISQPSTGLTTGWLLGDITHFDNRVHTPSSGWGHYPMTHEVIPLFISALRNAEENFIDHPRYLPWNPQRRIGQNSCTPLVVEWHLPKPLLRWSTMGPYDLRGWMATCGQPEEDWWSVPAVVTSYGGPWLESSKWLSTPSDSSDLTRYHYCALFPTQDNEAWILGEESDWKTVDVLLTLIL